MPAKRLPHCSFYSYGGIRETMSTTINCKINCSLLLFVIRTRVPRDVAIFQHFEIFATDTAAPSVV